MKNNYWLIFGAMLSTSLLAQQATNPPAPGPIETPAPAAAVTSAPAMTAAPVPAEVKTNAPAAKAGKAKSTPGKKKAPAKQPAKPKAPAAELKTVPLVPGPAVVDAYHVNVRGQASLKGEVLTRLTKGQPVTVVEEIVKSHTGPEEPSAWAKILLPTNLHVWVSAHFIDATNKTVVPKKLNLRGGPGENYSVLGLLRRGDAVLEVATKGDWIQIEPPTNAFAFVASQYLKQEVPAPTAPAIAATPAAPTPPATPATPATVTEAPAIASTTTEMPMTNVTAESSAITNLLAAAAPTNAPTETPAEPGVVEPPPKRIVEHEGVVRGFTSIQAPSHFALINPETGRIVDYLHTTSRELDLNRYKGLRIVVTGEEALDERWPNTPVITIQRIQVVE